MTKEELKAYISEAVDALEEGDLEILFPKQAQPGLYAMMEEVIGLKGAFNKLSGSTLRLNQEVQTLLENKEAKEGNRQKVENEGQLESQLSAMLWRLIDMDEQLSFTKNNFENLPQLSKKNRESFDIQYTSWKKGFAITLDRWEKLLQTTDLQKIGQAGESFNPEIHEAVGVKNWPNIENNIIVETEQMGFFFNGQLLRTAKVVVNKVQAGMEKVSLIPKDDDTVSIKASKPAKKKKKKKRFKSIQLQIEPIKRKKKRKKKKDKKE